MNDDIKKGLQEIEDQLFSINARNISLRWIGFKKIPTPDEISELNQMLGYIVSEIRSLKETGSLDSKKVWEEYFGRKAE